MRAPLALLLLLLLRATTTTMLSADKDVEAIWRMTMLLADCELPVPEFAKGLAPVQRAARKFGATLPAPMLARAVQQRLRKDVPNPDIARLLAICPGADARWASQQLALPHVTLDSLASALLEGLPPAAPAQAVGDAPILDWLAAAFPLHAVGVVRDVAVAFLNDFLVSATVLAQLAPTLRRPRAAAAAAQLRPLTAHVAVDVAVWQASQATQAAEAALWAAAKAGDVPVTECLVCMEAAPTELMLVCSGHADAQHPVCRPCAFAYLYAAMYTDNVAKRACVSATDGCAGVYPEPMLAATLGVYYRAFARMEARSALAGLASRDAVFLCPCGNNGVEVEAVAAAAVFSCEVCNRITCLACESKDHRPHACGDAGATQRKALEEAMTSIIVRACDCGMKFIKLSGCNKMTCVCGKYMCNVCKQPIAGYGHFCTCGHKHTCTRCHLYSDAEAADAARLRALNNA